MPAMNRAYSLLEIRSVDSDQRTIRGVATTPTPDRMGDIVEPLGVSFKNPLPLLWQHMSSKPVGLVKFDKPTKAGITFEATISKIDEPGVLKERLDEAWQSVKAGLVRAVSIGFRALEHAMLENGRGIRFVKSEVLELSLVTIPANADATINVIRSVDTAIRHANGIEDAAGPNPPGVSGSATPPRTRATMPTIAEQIASFEATRQNKSARMEALMNEAAEKGETLDAQQAEEYDTLKGELKQIDEHLGRLRDHERLNIQRAAAVQGGDVDAAARSRAGIGHNSGPAGVGSVPATVRTTKLEKGIAFTRYVLALARAKGNIMMAAEMAKENQQWRAETPDVIDVLRAAVSAGTTTDTVWAGPLVQYQNLTSEFIEYLRPLTIIGRIPGLRRVPFKVKIPRQTGGASVNWVGEAKVKPVSSLAFDSLTLEFAKIAGIVPLSEELVRFSSPSAETLVRDDLAAAIVQFMDSEFVSPTKASNDVSPASITYGVTPVTASGTTGAALRADVKTLIASFLSQNLSVANAVWIMTQQSAMAIGMMQNTLGQPEFPTINMNGGTFMGLPVVTSENVPATGGSPTDGFPLILAKADDILLADDGQVTIDASREASLQMDTTPDSPPTASTTLVSLWQHNMVAIKAERYINWAKRRTGSVQYIQNAKYME